MEIRKSDILREPIRNIPRILDKDSRRIFLDWRKDDYTKINNSVNYCVFDTSNLPERPGIYFLYDNEELLYIGMTTVSIKTRVRNHISVNKHITNANEPLKIDRWLHRVNRVEYEEYPIRELAWIELFYQCKLKPKY